MILARELRPFLTLLSVAALHAGPVAAQTLTPAWRGPDGGMCWTLSPRERGIAVTRDGSIWLLVAQVATAQSPKDLLLLRSADGGLSWKAVASAPSADDAAGGIVAAPDGGGLHVVWTGRAAVGEPFSVWHQAFDTEASAWVGEPEAIAKGTTPQNQFHVTDVDVTAKGALVVAVMANAAPPPPWRGAWSGAIFVLRGGKWGAAQPVNVASTCGSPQLAVAGENVHVAYTTMRGKLLLCYRTFDTAAERWLQAEDVAISDPDGPPPANTFSFAVDDVGRLHALYPIGTPPGVAAGAPIAPFSAPLDPKRPLTVQLPRQVPAAAVAKGANGALILASAMPGDPWQRHVLAEDEKLRGGGDALYAHFTLARAPGTGLLAVFSRPSDEFATLWNAHVSEGAPVGEPRCIARAAPQAFSYVNGLRTGGCTTSLQAIASGITADAPCGRVALVGARPPIRVRF